MWPKPYICDLLDSLDVAICEFDAEHRAVRWNARFLEFFPEHASFIHFGELYAENLRRFYKIRLDPSDLPDIERYVTEGVARHTQQQQPFEFTHHGRTVKVASLPLPDGGRVRMWREVRRPDAKLSSTIPAFDVLDHIPDGACVTDASNRIVIANAEFRRLYDVPSDLVIVGQTLEDIIASAWNSGPAIGAMRARIRAGLTYDGAPFEVELPRNRWRRVVNRHEGDGLSYQVHADITDSKLQQQQLVEARDLLRQKNEALAELARTDSLTGLPNRRQFIDQLTHELERSGLAVLIAIDIDNFKAINDRFGHPVGDVCIRKIGRIIDKCAKAAGATAARTGGEEFAIIGSKDLATADGIAVAVHGAVASADWRAVHPEIARVTLSVGIAEGAVLEELQIAADRALYRAKAQGRDRTERFVA
jgi:diguanylate cyclase (GGDEF)-like protein